LGFDPRLQHVSAPHLLRLKQRLGGLQAFRADRNKLVVQVHSPLRNEHLVERFADIGENAELPAREFHLCLNDLLLGHRPVQTQLASKHQIALNHHTLLFGLSPTAKLLAAVANDRIGIEARLEPLTLSGLDAGLRLDQRGMLRDRDLLRLRQ